jgi:membrane protein
VCASQVDSRKQSERALGAFDRWQRRHTAAAFPVAVMRKFLDDRASSLAALVAYYAFFSLFPLLLVFVSVLGFVLQDNPSLQQDVLDSALARIPVIGAQLQDDVEPLTGSASALALGLAGALWAGLGVTLAFGRAFEDIWDVPRLRQRGAVRARVRGLLILGVLGVSLIAATVVAGLALGGRIGPAAEELGAVGVVLSVNLTAFLAFFALLTPRPRRLMELLPGAALAAAGSFALQAAGGWYVERAVANAGDTYGVFALVIGLLSWFWLGAHLLLLAAEVNVVRRHRLWPRSLAGELEVADRVALGRTAAAVQQDERQEIRVRFTNDRESGPT